MPIQFIDGKCHIKMDKVVKLLYPVIIHGSVINALRADIHIQYTHIPMFADKKISRNQMRACLI